MNRSPRPSSSRPVRRHAAGFTLVELLVAFALFALISVLLAGGLRFGIRAWEVGRERAEPTGEVELAQNLLRRELSQAAQRRDEADTERTFTGSETMLTFSGPLPAAAAAGRLYAFTLRTTAEGERLNLTLDWRPAAGPTPTSETDADDAVLIENIAGLELAYFGTSAQGLAPAWSNRWSSESALPQLIRLRVVFPPGDRRLWPDLIVAPRYEFRS